MLSMLHYSYIANLVFGNLCIGFACAVGLSIAALLGKVWLFMTVCCGLYGLFQLFKQRQPIGQCTGFAWGSLYLVAYALAWVSENQPEYFVCALFVLAFIITWPFLTQRLEKPQLEQKWLRWAHDLGSLCCGIVGLWIGLMFCAYVGIEKVFGVTLLLLFLFCDVLIKNDGNKQEAELDEQVKLRMNS